MKSGEARAPHYPIRAVSKLTGIAIDTLRAWERRYGVVTPTRDDRGRLYSLADVERLRLLQNAIAAGHSIGRVAPLSNQELRRLTTAKTAGSTDASQRQAAGLDASVLGAALLRLDAAAIDQEFARLAAVLPPIDLVRDVLLPTLRHAGDNWNSRRGGIAQEHLISSAIRHMLGSFLRLYARRDSTIRLAFATPSGDRHEIGILGAAMLAASHGLGVTYLGPDLPAKDIADAVKATEARVLVLGLTIAQSEQESESELRTLLRRLPSKVELWAGGAAAARHTGLLSRRGIILDDFDAYLQQLARLGSRTGAS